MHNKLSKMLGIAILIIVLCNFVLKDVEDYFYFDSAIKNTASNIAISYVAAYIFYLLQVWYPDKLQKEKMNTVIAAPLSRILNDMQPIIKVFGECEDFKNKVDFMFNNEKLKSINMLEKNAPLLIPSGNKLRNADYIEFIIYSKQQVSESIKRINSLNYYNLDLNVLLDEIINSGLYQSVSLFEGGTKSLLKEDGFKADILNKDLKRYYDLYFKLKEYMIENEIKITISNL